MDDNRLPSDAYDPRAARPRPRATESFAAADASPAALAPDGFASEPADDGLFASAKVRLALSIALVVVLLLSAIPLGTIFSTPETYAATIESLDEKRETVLTLTASSTAVSAAVSALPGDAGTPIADKLMDVSADFMIVLAAIYLEEFLLTTMGLAAFRILIPLGCLLAIGALLLYRKSTVYASLARIAAKVALLAVVLVVTVPASVLVTGNIEAMYDESINGTIAAAQGISEDAEEFNAAEEEDQSIIDTILSIPESVANSVTGVIDDAQNAINGFIASHDVMIVTSCVIPLLVLVFFLWVVKLVLGINVEAPMRVLRPRTLRRHAH